MNVFFSFILQDSDRCKRLFVEFDGIAMDYSRQRVTAETMDLLVRLAEAANVKGKIADMASGKHINITENRAVGHMALRAPKDATMVIDGANVVPEVHSVLDRIHAFVAQVRDGKALGVTGKPLTDVGVEYVYESLRRESSSAAAAEGRKLRFLANVDPVDVSRALEGLNPETTLVIVISKTFTTAETMLNAKTMRQWLVRSLGGGSAAGANEAEIVAKHMAAVSTNIPATTAFGINSERVFGFWDWVGGRYSVCSAVGMLPLSLHFGSKIMTRFLQGAHSIDHHFTTTPYASNLPVILGLLGVWNASFLGYASRALLPYSQALLRFPAHIQQVDMESNGKRVTVDGVPLPMDIMKGGAGPVDFGEPGTNGQHSFYQLLHQGRVVPSDFIGFCESQEPMTLPGEPVSNHDELMSNFFAQPDALAYGKTEEEVRAEGNPEHLVNHKVFPGNRPSTSLLLPRLDAYSCGQLLALYEHRTAVEGFIWNVPSFDQWGVELGKVLAKQVRNQLQASRKAAASVAGPIADGGMAEATADKAHPVRGVVGEGQGAIHGFNPSTTELLLRYLRHVDPTM
jgi:glucose-6-phosphate isomerase